MFSAETGVLAVSLLVEAIFLESWNLPDKRLLRPSFQQRVGGRKVSWTKEQGSLWEEMGWVGRVRQDLLSTSP